MKRMILFLLIAALFMPGVSFAALTCAKISFHELPNYSASKDAKYELLMRCTFDTTPGTAAYTFENAATNSSTTVRSPMEDLSGKWSYAVIVDPKTPAPDAASVQILDSRGVSFLAAAYGGLNLVHATSTQQAFTEGPEGNDGSQMFNNAYPLAITVTDQATNNAVFDVYIQAYD